MAKKHVITVADVQSHVEQILAQSVSLGCNKRLWVKLPIPPHPRMLKPFRIEALMLVEQLPTDVGGWRITEYETLAEAVDEYNRLP